MALAEGWSGGKRYAFLGKENRLDLLEIASEGPPKPTGVSIALGGRPSEMAWEGDTLLAVVSAQDAYTLQVWDVSDVRRPKPVGSLPGVDRLFDVDGRRAYVSRREDPGKDVTYLIPDITRPQEMVKLEGFYVTHGVKGAGELAYVLWTPVPTARNEPLVTVLDVSAKGSPYVVGELEGVYTTRGALADGRLFLWVDAWGLTVLDVSDASHPRLLSEPLRGSGSVSVSTLDIDDSVAFLVDGTRLYLLLYGGDWGVYRWRLQALDVSGPAQPKELGSVEGWGVPAGMWLQGQQVVVADWYGMTVVDVSDPAQPKEGQRVPAGASGDVFLRGENAFLFTRGGLFALDLSGPEAPQLAAFRYFGPIGSASDLGGNRFRATVYGEYRAYEVDLSNPYEPRLEESRSDRPPAPRASLGPYTLLAACGNLFVEDPTQRRGGLGTVARVRLAESNCSDQWDVAAVGQAVYVVGNGKLYLFDVSDPKSPKLIAEKLLAENVGETDKQQARILIEGAHACVLHGGLWVLDLSNPLQPREVAYYATGALSLDVDGDSIALLGPDGTFELLKLERWRQ